MEPPLPPRRPRWYQISLRELLGLLILTGVVGAAFVQSRQIASLERSIAHKLAKEAPLYSGIASGGVTQRLGSGSNTKYLYCHGCKIEVYESFVLIYGERTKSPNDFGNNQIMYIPREAVLGMSFQHQR